MKILQSLFGTPTWIGPAIAVVFFTFGAPGHAVEWFDDFSDGNANAPPIQWNPVSALPGDYDASSGDYILTGTEDGNDDETLASVVDTTFLNTSVRTQALVGYSAMADPDRNADFDASGNVTGSDMLIWQKGANGTGTQPEGDANFDGLIDGNDLNAWRDQFGGPPNLFGGNVGVVARFNPATVSGYVMLIDDGNQWNLLAIEGGDVVAKLNDGDGANVGDPDEDEVPVDPETGERINAKTDVLMQLDVTGEGADTLLEVWFWRPDQPMPVEPFFSTLDPDGGQFPVGAGVAGVLYNEDEDGSPGIYRFVQASDTHLGAVAPVVAAVPEPASAVLALLTVLATGLVMRPKRGQ